MVFERILAGIDRTGGAQSGLLAGGKLSINGGDPALFDIAAGSGQVVDFSDPSEPVTTRVSWSGFTAQTVTALATREATGIFIDSAGAIVERTFDTVTDLDFRQDIFLGVLLHPDNVAISEVSDTPFLAYSGPADFRDLLRILGPINRAGNKYTPNGANLSVDRSAGSVLQTGSNIHTDPELPSIIASSAAVPVTLDRVLRAATPSQINIVADGVTTIDPDNYDNGGGSVTAVPAGNFTIQRVYFLPSTEETWVAFGQALFLTLEDAVTSAGKEPFEAPDILGLYALRAFIVVQEGATDLTDTATAVFLDPLSVTVGGSGPTGGESNAIVNVGSGAEIFRDKVGAVFNLRTLLGLDGFDFTVNGDVIELSHTARVYDEAEAEQTTTSAVAPGISALQITKTGAMPAGTYRLEWDFTWRRATATNDAIFTIDQDGLGGTILWTASEEASDADATTRTPASGSKEFSLDGAAHTFDLAFRGESGVFTTGISQVHMLLKLVGP